ncbi:MAG: DUF4157 domain-containing protein [Actinomycetales bacterium]
MHDHDIDQSDRALRPKAASAEHRASHAGRAAGAGRPDTLGVDDVLALQRSAGNSGTGDLLEESRSPVLDVVAGAGRPLEPEVRQDMESRLGHDFSDVRIHDDSAAHSSAESVRAHAYTVGSDVVFQRDAYDPGSHQGRTTLAHELTHVVQQRQGAVDGTSTGTGIQVSDPGDRFEREAAATAERVMAGPTPAVQRDGLEDQTEAGQGTVGQPAGLQRQAEAPGEDEEELVQGSFVQRQEEEDELVQGSFVQREETAAEDEQQEDDG